MNGLLFCVSSIDVLMHIGSYELNNYEFSSQNTLKSNKESQKNSKDRISRLIQHFFNQKRFFY